MNPTKTDLLGQAKRDHQRRTERLVQAGAHHMASAQHYSDETYLACLRDSLAELATIWREEATATMEANKRGAKGTADSLRDCATRIMGVVEGIKNHGLDIPSEPDSMPVATDEDLNQPVQTLSPDTSITYDVSTYQGTDQGPAWIVTDIQTGGQHEENAGTPITAEQFMNSGGILDTTITDDAAQTIRAVWTDGVSETINSKVQVLPEGHEAIVTENPFSFGEPKTWEQRNMPEIPVMHLEDDPASWLAPPDHTSVSQASMAAGCGMEWWLKYRRGAPERPSWANIGGKAFHTFVENIEHGRFGPPDDLMNGQVATFTPDYVRNQFVLYLEHEILSLQGNPYPMDTWHASKQGKEGKDWWRAEGPEMIHRYLEWRKGWRAQGWEIAYRGTTKVIELPFESRGVKGYVDSAWIRLVPGTAAFDIIILDWKSGSSAPADYIQPTQYAIALMDAGVIHGLTRHVLGGYWNARTGTLGPVADLKVRHTVAEVLTRLEAPKRMDAAGLYMPNVNSGYGGCGSCSRKLSCPVGSQQGKAIVDLEQLTT